MEHVRRRCGPKKKNLGNPPAMEVMEGMIKSNVKKVFKRAIDLLKYRRLWHFCPA
jgi:hypothetical protein